MSTPSDTMATETSQRRSLLRKALMRWSAFGIPNAWLWAYLVFAVSNAMLPSSSDRQPLIALMIYVVLVGLIFYLLGWLRHLIIPADIMTEAIRALRTLTTAFVFTIALDLVVALLLLGIQIVLVPLRGVE